MNASKQKKALILLKKPLSNFKEKKQKKPLFRISKKKTFESQRKTQMPIRLFELQEPFKVATFLITLTQLEKNWIKK